ncbi:MAG: DUF4250 domain-containing protein [Saccharofermentans sp.]|nr:DUF4250 domain-containing protein [Mageeibacillus sp.]MCI1263569.1 DUF4250 domain-containing protein [Saccharofermentans sp.]MCI1274492.1 DUF4250 domain-containing protein [Saccharofermentans sp.]
MSGDPNILFSYVNTQLRDNYDSLDDMCKSLGLDEDEIRQKLAGIGYQYSEEQNRFIPVG